MLIAILVNSLPTPKLGRDGWVERIKIRLLAAVYWSALVFEFYVCYLRVSFNCACQKTQMTEQTEHRNRTWKCIPPLPYPAPQLLRAAGSVSAAKAFLHLASLHYGASDGCSYGAYDVTGCGVATWLLARFFLGCNMVAHKTLSKVGAKLLTINLPTPKAESPDYADCNSGELCLLPLPVYWIPGNESVSALLQHLWSKGGNKWKGLDMQIS